MTGEAFIGDAVRTSLGRHAGARLVLTAVRELRRAKRALRTTRIGVGQGIAAVIERV